MIGAGVVMILLALGGLVLQWRGRLERARWFQFAAVAGILLPVLANWTGWMFTEMGRQPWVVFGLLKTSDARSPNVSSTDVILTLGGFIAVFAILTAVGGYLMLREARHGPDDGLPTGGDAAPTTAPDLVLAY